MKNSIAVVALALSLVSLGFQAHNAKPAARFDKFLVPVQISDFDYRSLAADQHMLRSSVVMQNGIGVPFLKKVSDDHERLVVWVIVSDEDMPKGYDERKKALLVAAVGAVSVVGSEFDFGFEPNAVSVEFWTMAQIMNKVKLPYAEYVKGGLIVH